jgi:hypothetical protein
MLNRCFEEDRLESVAAIPAHNAEEMDFSCEEVLRVHDLGM